MQTIITNMNNEKFRFFVMLIEKNGLMKLVLLKIKTSVNRKLFTSSKITKFKTIIKKTFQAKDELRKFHHFFFLSSLTKTGFSFVNGIISTPKNGLNFSGTIIPLSVW